MRMDQPVSFQLENPLVSGQSDLQPDSHAMLIGIEVHLVSETELEEGGDISFPNNENDSNISVQSVIPNPTLSM